MNIITNALPNIPRLYTGICEWLACMVYLLVIYRRASKSRSVLVAAIGLPAIIGIQYFAGAMSLDFWVFGMLLAVAGMYLVIFLGGQTTSRESLYITARAFVLAELIASLHWQIAAFIGFDRYNHGHTSVLGLDLSTAMLATVIYLVGFGLAWAVERRNFERDRAMNPSRTAVAGSIIITIVTFAMSNLSFVSTNTPFSGSVGQEIFYIRTLVDLCGYAILGAQQEQARVTRANIELASIDAKLQSEHQEYLQSKENIESLGRISHDLKHQLTALRAEVDPEHAAAGFEQIEESVQEYSAQEHTGNSVLDVILTSKVKTCVQQGITLTTVADGKLLGDMSSMDIATLFGNALDNAIEAASQVKEPERRLIKLALHEHGQFTVIRVENYYESALKKDDEGNLRTTKSDMHSHGYGVKSIKHIAGLYHGNVTIETHNHWFVLTVLLPK
ncbi:GHKL domain-containing protein [Bifidobacterium sp. ESL0682]|uniref:sensor histidine kinase n=1 Tax=Bifidobacterium sp. ESL0682 TaxID=2983212 RepID=UPI0023F78A3C|nr:GHKL domain-containing protein [Bifidobacterium sp. ESL0682]WEV42031.1 GHKL domain-containing protein [Bifidobacterium sp. ESL0682]